MKSLNSQNLNSTDFHLPYNRQLVERARELHQQPTPAEQKLWHHYLKDFKFRVLRQRPIDNFIVDFYCAALKLVIEVDGEGHFTEERQECDRDRTQILEGYGLTVIRFTNEQILNEFEGVCQQVEASIPPSPLKKGKLEVNLSKSRFQKKFKRISTDNVA